MTDIESTIDTYLGVWAETDADRRSALLEAVWSDDGELVDPPQVAKGHAEISDTAAGLQAQFPDHTFRRVSAVDAHHDQFRYGWELVGRDGTVAVSGIDVGAVRDDGKICRITGFFGPLAP